jgi:hypothetical protein
MNSENSAHGEHRSLRGFKTTVRLENEAFRGVNRSFETPSGWRVCGRVPAVIFSWARRSRRRLDGA